MAFYFFFKRQADACRREIAAGSAQSLLELRYWAQRETCAVTHSHYMTCPRSECEAVMAEFEKQYIKLLQIQNALFEGRTDYPPLYQGIAPLV